MLKIENVSVTGWEAALRGMRNPMNSWDKHDSGYDFESQSMVDDKLTMVYKIGPNDYKLMMNLCKGGTEESKWRRMIHVTFDVTAPLYWISEHDTYKVGTTRNSCSFMHKGISKPFEINDFSVSDDRIYYLLNPIAKEKSVLKYPYETDEYRVYTLENGRQYKVFRNGKIVSLPFKTENNYKSGRTRAFPEREILPSQTRTGYFELNLGGRVGEKWLLHRLVAATWIENPNGYDTVNHIDGDKGNNCVENLEWCSREDNIKVGFQNGLYSENQLHASYDKWKRGHSKDPIVNRSIRADHSKGISRAQLAEKYALTVKEIDNILYLPKSADAELFYDAYIWEKTIDCLNNLREVYLDAKDQNVFQAIRQILPCGYNQKYTYDANYEVLAAQYRQRKNHRLPEWHTYCDWIKTLPYSEFITGEKDV